MKVTLPLYTAKAASKYKATPVAVKSMTAIYGKKVAKRLIAACESLALTESKGIRLNHQISMDLVRPFLTGYNIEVPALKVSMATVKELEVLAEWNKAQLNAPRFTSALEKLGKNHAKLPAKSPIWKPIRKQLATALGVKATAINIYKSSVAVTIGKKMFAIRMDVSARGKVQWIASHDRNTDMDGKSQEFKGKSSSDPLMYEFLAAKLGKK